MQSKTKFGVAARHDVTLTTHELAVFLGVEEHTPRASLCRHGHWMGMVPLKLPNGRLLWNATDVEQLLTGNAAPKRRKSDEPPASDAPKIRRKPCVHSDPALELDERSAQ